MSSSRWSLSFRHARESRHPGQATGLGPWIPAFAGMTIHKSARFASCQAVALAPVDGVEGVADHRFLALIDDRGLLRDPDHIARAALEDFLAGAQAKEPLQHDDHLVIEHRPLDGAAIEAREPDAHGLAEIGADEARDGRLARRAAIGLELHLRALVVPDAGHRLI